MPPGRPAPCVHSLAAVSTLLVATPVFAACPSDTAQVVAEARAAAEAFGTLDERRFSAARDSMREGLSCLVDAPNPTQSALIHQTEALAWFQARDRPRTVAALRSMRASDPTLSPDEALAPVGGELRDWMVELQDVADEARTPQQVPFGCTLLVDGEPETSLPAGRASVVVLLGPDHTALWSGLLPAGASLPAVPTLRLAETQAAPARHPGRAPLLTAGGLALASAGMWAVAARDRGALSELQEQVEAGADPGDLGWTSAELRALHGQAGILRLGAGLGAGLSVGLGVTGLVLRW